MDSEKQKDFVQSQKCRMAQLGVSKVLCFALASFSLYEKVQGVSGQSIKERKLSVNNKFEI